MTSVRWRWEYTAIHLQRPENGFQIWIILSTFWAACVFPTATGEQYANAKKSLYCMSLPTRWNKENLPYDIANQNLCGWWEWLGGKQSYPWSCAATRWLRICCSYYFQIKAACYSADLKLQENHGEVIFQFKSPPKKEYIFCIFYVFL